MLLFVGTSSATQMSTCQGGHIAIDPLRGQQNLFWCYFSRFRTPLGSVPNGLLEPYYSLPHEMDIRHIDESLWRMSVYIRRQLQLNPMFPRTKLQGPSSPADFSRYRTTNNPLETLPEAPKTNGHRPKWMRHITFQNGQSAGHRSDAYPGKAGSCRLDTQKRSGGVVERMTAPSMAVAAGGFGLLGQGGEPPIRQGRPPG